MRICQPPERDLLVWKKITQRLKAHLCSNTNDKQICQFQRIISNDAILQSSNNSYSGVQRVSK